MKLGMWSTDREALRRDGLVLFSKLIRTKNVDALQEQSRTPRPDDRKQKLTVSDFNVSIDSYVTIKT